METEIEITKTSPDNAPMDLLLLADPSEWMIREYLPLGDCYIARKNGQVIGAYVIIPYPYDNLEIKNISVHPEFRNQGVGNRLIMHAIDLCRRNHTQVLAVKTADSSRIALSFYKKRGFEVDSIVRGYFLKYYDKPITEDGKEAIDQIILKKQIS